MKVLVIGATGGTGRAALDELVNAGHEVTAFVRRPEALRDVADRVRIVTGDATQPDDVERAVQGQDGVIVTLGIHENPLRVRILGSAGTPIDVRSRGTRTVVNAMRRHGVRKLIVQSSYGVGETRALLPGRYKLMFRLLLRDQIADTELQEREVRDSGLDWVIAQPVNLTDGPDTGDAFVSLAGEARRMQVSRRGVARFLVEALGRPDYVGRSIALSTA